MNRVEILEAATAFTEGPRRRAYGDPTESHIKIAAGWSVIFGGDIEPHQVALAMAWLKTCRALASPNDVDSYVDGAAYMAIAGECAGVAE